MSITDGTPDDTDGPGEEIRILHIDDDPDFLDLTATVLERREERLTVETTTDPTDVIERFGESMVDCIVSDYDMPGMDGIELLETVRNEYPELPFILFTGKGSEEVAGEAISVGVTDYLQKQSGTQQYELLCKRIENAVERYHQSQRLRQTRRRYRRIFEQSHDAIMVLDPFEDEITSANERACDLLGYHHDELLSLSPSEIHPHEIDRFRQFVETVYEDDTGWTDELSCRTADGTLRPVHVSASRITIDGQHRLLTLIRERSDDGEAVDKELYRTMLDHATDGIYLVNPENGELLDANATACKRLGYDRDELRDKSVPDIAAPGTVTSWEQHAETLLDGEWMSEGLAHQRADGTTYSIALKVTHVVVGDDETYMIAVVKNLSETDDSDQ